MRRLVLVPLILLAVFIVGCGGGSGTGSSGSNGSEEAWSEEVAAVMNHFRADVEALQGEFKSLPPQQSAAEGMYMGLADKVSGLTEELKAIETPEQCRPTMSKIVGSMDEFAAFAEELGDQPTMTVKQYGTLAHEKIGRAAVTVRELGEISAVPSC